MARTVQELKYRLVADEQNLVKGLKSADERTKRLAARFDSAGKALSKGLTLPLVAAGGAMVKLALDAGNAADRILDLEQITGLSTDTIQELDVVAAEAGVSADGLARSVQRFSSRLPTLENGTSEGAKAIKSLGVNLRDTSGNVRDADALFPDLISSLSEIENEFERNALASQIFGRQMDDLAPVLGLGAGEFDRLRKSAQDSGLVLEREALNAANEFRVEVDQLQLRLQRTAQRIGTDLIPVIKDLIPVVEDILTTVTGAIEAFTELDTGTQKVILGFGAFTAAAGPSLILIGKMIPALRTLKVALVAVRVVGLGPIAIAAAAVTAGVAAMVKIFGGLQDHLNEQTEKELADRYGDLRDSVGLTTDELNTFNKQLNQIQTSGFGVDETADLLSQITEDYGLSVDQAEQLLQKHEGINGELVDAVVLARQRREEEKKTLGDALGLSQTWEEIEESYRTQIEQSRERARIERQEREEQRRREAEDKEAREARLAALEQFNQTRRLAEVEYESGLITSEQLQERIVGAKREEIDALIEARYRIDQQSIGAERLRSLIRDVTDSTGEINRNFSEMDRTSESIGSKIEGWKATTAEVETTSRSIDGVFGTIAESSQIAGDFLRSVANVTADPSLSTVFEEVETSLTNIASLLDQIEAEQASKIVSTVKKIIGFFNKINELNREWAEASETTSAQVEAIGEQTQRQLFENTRTRLDQEFEAEINNIDRIEREKLDSINETEQARIDALRRGLSEELQRELEQLGILEESREQYYDNLYQKTLDQNENLTEEEKRRIREVLDEQLAAEKAREQAEEEATAKREAAEKKYRKDLAEFQREQFLFEQMLAVKQAQIARENAIANLTWAQKLQGEDARVAVAYAELISSIISQSPPPLPSFRTGGSFTVPQGFSNDSFPLPAAMAQSGERVTVETVQQQAVADMGGAQMMTVVLEMDGREIAQTVTEYQNDGIVRLELN